MSSTNMSDNSLSSADNNCRNPDGQPGGPWCYTEDPAVRWEYCTVPNCNSTCQRRNQCFQDPCVNQTCPAHPEAKCSVPYCKGCITEWYVGAHKVDCYDEFTTACKTTTLGREYVGHLPRTRSNYPCQEWMSQYPHRHHFKEGNAFFEKRDGSVVNAKNYCRNPDSKPEGPWCYTTDPDKRWEYCDVPKCTVEEECMDGWYRFESSCYKFIDSHRNHARSVKHCYFIDSHLVIVNSMQELEFLVELIKYVGITNAYDFFFWVGASRDSQNNFKWVDGTYLQDSSPLWFRGEPNSVYEDSAAIVLNNGQYGLVDLVDDEKNKFICEYELAASK